MPRRWLIGTLVAIASFLLIGRFAAAAYVDFLWFASLGATELWVIEFENRLLLGAGSALFAILFVFANLFAVRQSVVSLVLPRRLANLEIGEEVPRRYLTQITVAASVVLGLLLSFPGDRWLEFAAARHGTSFRERDPFFDYDLGFFVNVVPFEKSLFVWCLILLLVVIAVVFFLYALTPSLRWVKGEGLQVTHYVRRHAGVLSACVLIILAWSFRLEMFDSMLQGSGLDGVFTAADRAMLSARTALTVGSLLAAFLLAWAMWTDQLRMAFICVTTVLVAAVGTNLIIPLAVRESASPDVIAESERLYEGIRAQYTQRAYGVDDILPAEPAAAFSFPTWGDAAIGFSTWDTEQFDAAASRKAGGGVSAGDAGYENSPFGQLILSIVEAPVNVIGTAADASASQSWALVRALSGSAASEGTPRYLPESDALVPLHRVLISKTSSPLVVAPDPFQRLAAPEMESLVSRIAHAWSRQDFRMLFRDLPQPSPRILLNAGIRARVQKLAPFFEQDSLVYPVMSSDTLYWAVQLYSHSATYPLSKVVRYGERDLHYLRHAATALVNSATGGVALYVVETPDPVAQTWTTRLPGIFASAAVMSGYVAAMLPPAIEGARAQAEVYAKYGTRDDSIGGGTVALDAGDTARFAALHELLHLPALRETPVWMQPLLDNNNRINRIIVGVGGGSPRTYVLTLPTAQQSWLEILQRLDEIKDSIASREEGTVVAGTLRAFTVGGQLALARTTYAVSGSTGPVIAAVSIVSGDSTWTAPSFSAAARVRLPAGDDSVMTPLAFRERVQDIYQRMRNALQKMDFAAFGEALDALGAILSGTRR